MKILLVVLIVGIVGANADDAFWMDMFSLQLDDAMVRSKEGKNIPELAADLGLHDFLKLLDKVKLTDTLTEPGPFTVFGPTDRAIQKVPKGLAHYLLSNLTVLGEVLKYHVVSKDYLSGELTNDQLIPTLYKGKDIRINIYHVDNEKVITASGRPVYLADQKASNGLVYKMSGVLLPPGNTIGHIVSRSPNLKTLHIAADAAGILEKLKCASPLTMFAPSEVAFKKLPVKCLDKLLNNIPLLTKVLQYHLVDSTEYFAGLQCGQRLKTEEGNTVKISKKSGELYVNDANVYFADGSTTNGVIHVIDKVLLPKEAANLCTETKSEQLPLNW